MFSGMKTSFSQSSELERIQRFIETMKISDHISPESLSSLRPGEKVIDSFILLRENDFSSFRTYIVLYYLNLYLAHLKCCNQTYDLRSTEGSILGLDCEVDRLLCAFIDLNEDIESNTYIEFLPSSLSYAYFLRNPDLGNNESISQIIKLIRNEQKRLNASIEP